MTTMMLAEHKVHHQPPTPEKKCHRIRKTQCLCACIFRVLTISLKRLFSILFLHSTRYEKKYKWST